MPRYTLQSVEVSDRKYENLPESTRRLADRRIEELLDNPTGNPYKEYDPQFDQWSIPIGDDTGWILWYPQQQFSLARRSISAAVSALTGGRPGRGG
jgi:hypothetical protein